MKVFSIDIGISNLGFVYCNVEFPDIENTSKYKNLLLNSKYSFNNNITVLDCNRVDITVMKHTAVEHCNCKLYHERCIPDYIDHFVQEYQTYFNNADIILLERQPPAGITNVQDLLFIKYRDKTILISPVSVHKYFELNSDYLVRKSESEKIAGDYLSNFSKFVFNFRKHDISDSLLMVLYYYKIQMDRLINNFEFTKDCFDFEQFRFNFFTNDKVLKNNT
jgi:hypothetical protein